MGSFACSVLFQILWIALQEYWLVCSFLCRAYKIFLYCAETSANFNISGNLHSVIEKFINLHKVQFAFTKARPDNTLCRHVSSWLNSTSASTYAHWHTRQLMTAILPLRQTYMKGHSAFTEPDSKCLQSMIDTDISVQHPVRSDVFFICWMLQDTKGVCGDCQIGTHIHSIDSQRKSLIFC